MASLPMPYWSEGALHAPAPSQATQLKVVEAPARLTALEWSIVAIAQRDSLRSLREPGRVLGALASLFGIARVRPLANERLEILRRVAVLAWHYRWNVPKSELQAFLAAGFSTDQYELLQASIATARAARNKGRAR